MDWLLRLNRAPGRVPLLAAAGTAATAEVLHWDHSPHLPDNVPHRHAYFEVCLVGAYGAGEFRVEGTPHRIGPGDLFIARPGALHQIVNVGGPPGTPEAPDMELSWVTFAWGAGAADAPALAAFTDAAGVLVVHDAAGRIASLWRALRAAAEAAPLGGDVALTAVMGALLLAIAQAGGGAAPAAVAVAEGASAATDPARRAVRYIHENLGRRTLTAAEVADAVALSPRHLARVFAAYAGASPSGYIERARLERARTLLLRTDDPIKQVAALAGYGDVHHFTRAFARRFGCPPGRFRASGGAADRTERRGDRLDPGVLV